MDVVADDTSALDPKAVSEAGAKMAMHISSNPSKELDSGISGDILISSEADLGDVVRQKQNYKDLKQGDPENTMARLAGAMVFANDSSAPLVFNLGMVKPSHGVAKLGRKGHGRSSKHVSVGDGRASTIIKSALGKRQHSSVYESKILDHNVSEKKMCSGEENRRIGQDLGLNGGKAATDPGAIGQLTGAIGDAHQEQ
jgi:hypothetical protein